MELFGYFLFSQYLQLHLSMCHHQRSVKHSHSLDFKKSWFFVSRRDSSLFPFIPPTWHRYFVFVVLMACMKA
jgi:hypothetical protein